MNFWWRKFFKPLQPKVEGLYLMQSVCLFIYPNFKGLLLHWHHMSGTAFQINSNLTFFFNCVFRLTSNKTSKVHITWPSVWEIRWWLVDSPHKGPVVQKAVLCVSIIIMATGTLPSTNLTSLLDYSSRVFHCIRKVYNDQWPWPYVHHWKISDINC